jgi:pyrimidine deaminase RibD-like protein
MRFFELKESTYHVKNHSVYGKVLAQDGQTVLADPDTAELLAAKYNGSLIKALDGKRYIIKLSEAPPHVVGESLHRQPFSDPVAMLKHKLDRMEHADSSQIDLVMLKIANRQGISVEQLHKMWTDKYKQSPDELYAAGDEAQDKRLSLPEGTADSEPKSDYEIHDYKKLDKILAKLCEMVDKGQNKDPEKYGMVAACVLDTDNRIVTGINLPAAGGKRLHAERVAIDNYHKKYGEIPKGSIIVTTCSPCSEHMDERYGEDCTQLISDVGIEKVYCGFNDPTQEEENNQFNLIETSNQKIRDKCKQFAEHFMDYEQEQANENFADGKGPGRPGDSQRHGIPKGATMAQLEKASHAKGRKGQLARWQLNMRRGKKK